MFPNRAESREWCDRPIPSFGDRTARAVICPGQVDERIEALATYHTGGHIGGTCPDSLWGTVIQPSIPDRPPGPRKRERGPASSPPSRRLGCT